MKTLIRLSLLALFLVPMTIAEAHPPTNVKMSFDRKDYLLTVTGDHFTPDASSHYISHIVIKHADNDEESWPYTVQWYRDTFKKTFRVEADPGDSIRATVHSTDGGQATASMVAP